MQVIFTENTGSARADDIKNVKPGYARYLLFYGKAVPASEDAVIEAKKRQEERVKKLAEIKKQAEEVALSLQGKTLSFTEKANEEGGLFGAINEQMIVDALLSKLKIEATKDQVKILEPIKTVGTHSFSLHLAEGVNVNISVEVTAE
jgi:large subunit ribosomal protein L9